MRRRLTRRAAGFVLLGLLLVGGLTALGVYVTEEEPSWYARIRYPLQYEHIISSHSTNYEIDGALLAALIYRESKFDPEAVSSSGAIGLMQLLPTTADGIALFTGGDEFQHEDLYDPEINVRYGSFYLRRLLTKYERLDLALAAYNAGQANVDEWIDSNAGIAYPETREYVRDVVRLSSVYRRAYGSRLGDELETVGTSTEP